MPLIKFKINGTAKISIQGPAGFSESINNISTNAQGKFSYTYTTPVAMSLGNYNIQATDVISGLTAPVKPFKLNGTNVSSYLQILNPISGSSFNANENITIEWKDYLVIGNNYSLSGSKRNYKYIIEYSDNGGTLQPIGTVVGQGYINNYVTEIQGFNHGAGSSNMRVRVTDFYNPSNFQISPSFVINSPIATNIKVDLNWDMSYPTVSVLLVQGVAADGAARIFLNLSKINPSIGQSIINVKVSLSDAANDADYKTLGRVKVASQIAYNLDANELQSIEETDNTAKTNYLFWYVAPDDFEIGRAHV